MEIPNNLKRLYTHWQFHTKLPITNNRVDISIDPLVENKMIEFASERMTIWGKKTKGLNKPYTNDKILQRYRFCNIYRELDRQTIEFHQLTKPLKNNLSLWLLNILFCRLICNVNTIRQTGFLNFDDKNNKKVFRKLKSLPRPKYGTAYIFPVSLIMKSKYPTREEFFCFYLPATIKKVTAVIKSLKEEGVADALQKILPIFGFNLKFHWTEVLIDLAYQYPEHIDLFKKFPIGPGSIPSMRLLSNCTEPESVCMKVVNDQPFKDFPYLTFNSKKIYLSAENVEGIGCEYRKYTNLKTGKGRRRVYN